MSSFSKYLSGTTSSLMASIAAKDRQVLGPQTRTACVARRPNQSLPHSICRGHGSHLSKEHLLQRRAAGPRSPYQPLGDGQKESLASGLHVSCFLLSAECRVSHDPS